MEGGGGITFFNIEHDLDCWQIKIKVVGWIFFSSSFRPWRAPPASTWASAWATGSPSLRWPATAAPWRPWPCWPPRPAAAAAGPWSRRPPSPTAASGWRCRRPIRPSAVGAQSPRWPRCCGPSPGGGSWPRRRQSWTGTRRSGTSRRRESLEKQHSNVMIIYLVQARLSVPIPGWTQNRPDLSLEMDRAGMDTSMGRLPGEVMLGEGLSSTRCRVMFSKLIFK